MSVAPDGAVTELLARWRAGDDSARDRLMTLVFDELREVARRQMHREQAGHTLQPTALVGELYLRLCGKQKPDYADLSHFFGIAAGVMRRILIDHARVKKAVKRGGGRGAGTDLDESVAAPQPPLDPAELLAIDQALADLDQVNAQAARLVELHYFAGFDLDETAGLLGISTATAKRRHAFARAFVLRRLSA